jgi:hypothetical protein
MSISPRLNRESRLLYKLRMGQQPVPEKEKKRGIRDVIQKLRDMLSLTHQEKALIVAILLSVVIGATIQRCRSVYRIKHPTVIGSPTPRPSMRAKDIYGAAWATPSPPKPASDDEERER